MDRLAGSLLVIVALALAVYGIGPDRGGADPGAHACGALAREAATIAVLRSIEGGLDEPALFPWLDAAMAPIKRIRDKIRQDPAQAVLLSPADLAARIREADVIVVADQHDVYGCQHAFARVLRQLAPIAKADHRPLRVGLEMIPDDRIAEARRVFAPDAAGGAEAVRAFMRRCVGWPVNGYVPVAQAVREVRAALTPVGFLAAHPDVVDPGASDEDRMPLGPPFDRVDEFEGEFFSRNVRVADAVERAHRRDPRALTFLLYGGAHLLDHQPGFGNLREHFLARGLKPLFLFPFVRDWELAIRETKPKPEWNGWFEVAPGVLRSPCMTDEEIRAYARARRRGG